MFLVIDEKAREVSNKRSGFGQKKEGKGKERKGKERKGKERKGKERKGKERKELKKGGNEMESN